MLPQTWLQQQPTGSIQNNQTLQACQQKLRLQSLHMERERLKQRRQEIMRQVKSLVLPEKITESAISSDAYYRAKRKYKFSCLQQELMMQQSTTDAAMDPFLSGINEQHARQESADSGLGLGSAYSLSHTPDDFLAIDDNMDGTSGKNSSTKTFKK